MDGEFRPFNPDELDLAMELTEAIAERDLIDHRLRNEIYSELSGRPYESDADLERAMHLGNAAMNLAAILNPGYKVAIQEYMDTILSFGGTSSLVGYILKQSGLDQVEDEEWFDKSAVQDKAAQYFRSHAINEFGGENPDTEVDFEPFQKLLRAAEAVAAGNGVRTSDVYRTDALYYEAYRHSKEPGHFVAEALYDLMSKTFASERQKVELLIEAIPDEIKNQYDPDELAALNAEYLASDELAEEVWENVHTEREYVRQVFAVECAQIYGTETLAKYTGEEYPSLRPTRPYVTAALERMLTLPG